MLSELFHIQSSWWRDIADDQLAAIYGKGTMLLKAALGHVAQDEQV
jgi:hypothetical protein